MIRLINLAALVFFSSASIAADITGMFSSFKPGISGDLSGIEVHIVPNPIGYSAVVQGSEGAPGFPLSLRIEVSGNSFNFIVPSQSGSGLAPGKWRGVITDNELQLNGPHRSYVLPRKHSFWQ